MCLGDRIELREEKNDTKQKHKRNIVSVWIVQSENITAVGDWNENENPNRIKQCSQSFTFRFMLHASAIGT